MKKILLLFFLIILTTCSKDSGVDDTPPPIVKYTLNVTASPTEGGIVNPQTGTYNAGQTVNIIASANDFFAFSNWSGSWNGSESNFTLTMDSNKNITANFEDLDIDNDLVLDSIDNCLNTPPGESVDQSGCGYSQLDDDGDGIANGIDQCPNSNGGYLSLFGVEFDNNGCKIDYAYLDENGVTVKAYPDSPVGKVTYINHPLYDNDPNLSEYTDVTLWEIVDNQIYSNLTDNSPYNGEIDEFHGAASANFKKGMVTTFISDNLPVYTYYESWDTSNVTKFSGTFNTISGPGFTMMNNENINYWDVSSAIDMSSMFSGFNPVDSNLNPIQIDVSSWDVSNVINMDRMFHGSNPFSLIGIENWDVSNVTNMNRMFWRTTNPYVSNTIIDLSNWNVQNVTDCSEFLLESTITNIILPNFTNCNPD